MNMNLPPNVQQGDRIILFDGVCKLCNACSNFIIKHDKKHHFKLCSVQSDEGQKILAHFKFSTSHFETMLYVEGRNCYQKSNAFFNIMSVLGMPWSFILIFKILPRFLRDWMYDRVALNRYKIFGQYDICQLPNADHDNRYLK